MKSLSAYLFLMPLFFLLKSDCNGGGRNGNPIATPPVEYNGTKIKIPANVEANLKIYRKLVLIENTNFRDSITLKINNGDEIHLGCNIDNHSYSYVVNTFNFARALHVINFNYSPSHNLSCGDNIGAYELSGSIINNSTIEPTHYTIRESFNGYATANTSQRPGFSINLPIRRSNDAPLDCISKIDILPSVTNTIAWQIIFNNVLDDAEINLVINDAAIFFEIEDQK
jgi:hypothetical protein